VCLLAAQLVPGDRQLPRPHPPALPQARGNLDPPSAAPGEAVASWGRIFKSFHVLALLDDESYRRDVKGIGNLQEGRHGLAGKIFHGRKGPIYERYHAGIEDQLEALGLVLNCVVLWNTTYMNAALDQLRRRATRSAARAWPGCPRS